MKSRESKLKFGIIMNDNSYVGREYLRELNCNDNYDVDVISIGVYPEDNKIE